MNTNGLLRSPVLGFAMWLAAVLLLPALARAQTVPVVDPGFNPDVSGNILAVAALPDGKWLISGHFIQVSGQPRAGLARLNADGSLDTGFNLRLGGGSAAVIKRHGEHIYVGGGFTSVNGDNSFRYLIRLHLDGSVDTGFSSPSWISQGNVREVLIQYDGMIVLAGSFMSTGGAPSHVARVDRTGVRDTSFTPPTLFQNPGYGVDALLQQEDGKLLLGGGFRTGTGAPRNYLLRLNTNGTHDDSFSVNVDDAVGVLQKDHDGILIAGNFYNVNGVPRDKMARLHADGTLDTSFGNPRVGNWVISAILPHPDGGWLIAGNFNTVGGQPRKNLAWINSDGSLNTGLGSIDISISNSIALSYVQRMALAPDGRVLIAGYFTQVGGQNRNHIALLRLPRSTQLPMLDQDFAPSFNGPVRAVLRLQSGTYLVGGSFTRVNNVPLRYLVALDANGRIDASFPGLLLDGPVHALTFSYVHDAVKIYVGGGFTSPGNALIRLNIDGTLDTGFTSPSWISGSVLALQHLHATGPFASPTLLVGGDFQSTNPQYKSYLNKINSSGAYIQNFGNNMPNFGGAVRKIGISSGNYIVAGSFSLEGGAPRQYILRLHGRSSSQPEGTLDQGFADGLQLNNTVRDFVTDPKGIFTIAGDFTHIDSLSYGRVGRLHNDGQVIAPYANADADDNVHSIVSREDKYLIGGEFRHVGGENRPGLARIHNGYTSLPSHVRAGEVDASFANLGINGTVRKIFLVNNNNTAAVIGDFTSVQGHPRYGMALLHLDTGLPDEIFEDGFE